MKETLEDIYAGLEPPLASDHARVAYSVKPIPELPGCYLGRDVQGNACVLISVSSGGQRTHAPIRLENLEAYFDVPSRVTSNNGTTDGVFTVICCRSLEADVQRYFFSACYSALLLLGVDPSETDVRRAVDCLTSIFQRLKTPPTRSVTGLFGELFVIRHSCQPARLVSAWRSEGVSRFDFSEGDIRLDVKATAGRTRAHTFSYEQCNPPPGTVAFVASLFAERASGGISIYDLMIAIQNSLRTRPDLVLKLHEVVATTLGVSLQDGIRVQFDKRLARSSLQFFDLRTIPAIRGEHPAGVSDVHFRSDLSGSTPIHAAELPDLAHGFLS